MRSIPVQRRSLRRILAVEALAGLAGCARPATWKSPGELSPRERGSLLLTAAGPRRVPWAYRFRVEPAPDPVLRATRSGPLR